MSIDPDILDQALGANSSFSQKSPAGAAPEDATIENIFLMSPGMDEFFFASQAEETSLSNKDPADDALDTPPPAETPFSDV